MITETECRLIQTRSLNVPENFKVYDGKQFRKIKDFLIKYIEKYGDDINDGEYRNGYGITTTKTEMETVNEYDFQFNTKPYHHFKILIGENLENRLERLPYGSKLIKYEFKNETEHGRKDVIIVHESDKQLSEYRRKFYDYMQVLKNNLDEFLKNEELDILEVQKTVTGMQTRDAYLTITHACLSYIKKNLKQLENIDFMNEFFQQAGINKKKAKKLLNEAIKQYQTTTQKK